jgi:hypothetical protein
MAKLLFILIMTGALADAVASAHSEPPLLIDASPQAPLDAAN